MGNDRILLTYKSEYAQIRLPYVSRGICVLNDWVFSPLKKLGLAESVEQVLHYTHTSKEELRNDFIERFISTQKKAGFPEDFCRAQAESMFASTMLMDFDYQEWNGDYMRKKSAYAPELVTPYGLDSYADAMELTDNGIFLNTDKFNKLFEVYISGKQAAKYRALQKCCEQLNELLGKGVNFLNFRRIFAFTDNGICISSQVTEKDLL